MKTINLISLTCFVVLAFSGCQEKVVDRYYANVPVYMNRSEFKSAVKVASAEEISEPGKIYFKDNFIFINEYLKGIHVIDNTDPANPDFVSFIKIPGNVDMAIKENILYADSYTDLVALDISDIDNIREVGRVDSIFPYTLPPVMEENQLPFGQVDTRKGIVVGWEVKEVEETITSSPAFPVFGIFDFARAEAISSKTYQTNGGSTTMSVGIAGSMARFTIIGNSLYTVDQFNLKVFDIDELDKPLLVANRSIGWGVETLFPYGDQLFFGTQTGMIIYDVSDPSNPEYVSRYDHIRSCDPVVVEDNYAYVTLRAGNLCGEATSQLDVIDISNIQKPVLKESYPMNEPYGLGIDNKTLFVCDGEAGLKVYNAEDPHNLVKIAWFQDVNAFDVIPFEGLLMMIGKDGLYQYDYTGPTDINLLSYIAITPQE